MRWQLAHTMSHFAISSSRALCGPLVINAADFDLAPGLDSLRKLAGLSAISLSVPVGAVLIFTAR